MKFPISEDLRTRNEKSAQLFLPLKTLRLQFRSVWVHAYWEQEPGFSFQPCHVHVCVYLCVYMCVHVCIACACVCMCVLHMHVCVHVCVSVHVSVLVCVHVCVSVCARGRVCGGQRTSCRNGVSPSSKEVPRVKFRLSRFLTSAFPFYPELS